jgi:hypothetical protein
MTREEMRALARKNVASWPDFTAEQHDRLHTLLTPMRVLLAEMRTDRPRGTGSAAA